MNFIILVGTFATVFYILLLVIKLRKSLPDVFLGLIFLFYGLNIGLTWAELYNAKLGYPHPRLLNISWLFLLLHGPAMWFYIKSYTIRPYRFRWIWMLHLVPFTAFAVAQYLDFFSLPAADRIRIVSEESFKDNTLYKLSVLAIAVSTITYNLWALKLIKEHRFRLRNHFSHLAGRDLRWLEVLIIANLVIYGINVSLFTLDLVFGFASYHFLMQLAYTFATIYTLVLGYYGIRQGNVFVTADLTPVIPVERALEGIRRFPPGEEDESSVNRLLTDMEIKNLALSEDASRLSIMGIAYECGFNSKAAFYRAFKKYENCSPSEYLSRLNKK